MLKEKSWSKKIEKKIAEKWKKNPFKFQIKGKIFSIDTPPPYVNMPVHIGQAITYCYMDFFARYKRMKGYSVIFPLGLDRNGLPIEIAAQEEFKVDPSKIGREKFIEYCKKILEHCSSETIDTFIRLGISFSSFKFGNKFGEAYMTDSPEYRTLTQSTFYDMYKKGLIYEDRKIVNYCPGCQTTLADAEVEYQEEKTKLYYIKFKTKEGKDLIIATTRPELINACKAVLFNPHDERYKDIGGKTVFTPLYNQEVKIMAHPSADMDLGTGLVMVCSFGDLTDIRFFKEQKIKPVILINQDGKMNENSGFLQELTIKEARKKIVEELQNKNFITKEEEIIHRSPICERSKDSVEFIEMQEYYLKQLKFKNEILKLQKKIRFFNESSRKILENWIQGIDQDWPLSRRRYYATPIPLWKCPKCNEIILGEKGKYIEPWKIKKTCPKCKKEAVPETRVFDTWFDSSISELYILGYNRNSNFKKIFPCSLRPQGKEIVRTWLYYTLLRAYLLFGKPAFEDVWINFHILDARRKKMSKSKGNVIDPKEIIKNEGSESLRFWSTIEGDLTKQDFACSRNKIKAESKTLNKLWNLSKFILQFPDKSKPLKLNALDKLFVNYIEYLTLFCEEKYENYNFHLPALKLRNFLWEIFASHYVELVKNRAYKKDKSAIYTLRYILQRLLLLLYPIIPMITSEIFEEFGNIHKQKFPKSKINKLKKLDEKLVGEIMELNSKIWKEKKEKGLSLKSKIKTLWLPKELLKFKSDFKTCHNAGKIVKGKFKVEFL